MDIELNYICCGEGENIIFLHGNGENLTYFHNQTEFFSQYYRVYAIDTRGHGGSPWGSADFTIGQFAQDLYEFMLIHGIERANILGFSDGANIAMVFALRHPEMVNRLVLNGGNLYSSGVKSSVQIPIIVAYHITRLISPVSNRAKKKSMMLGLMVNDPALTPEEISTIKKRTLVIAGSRDMIKRSHTELISESISGSRLVIIPGTHFIAEENPNEFNRAVFAFLSEE